MIASSVTVPQVTSNNGGGTKSPPPINDGTSPAPVSGLYHMGATVLDYQYSVQTNYACEHHKSSVSYPELSLFIYDLQKACNLNYLRIVYATGFTMYVTI